MAGIPQDQSPVQILVSDTTTNATPKITYSVPIAKSSGVYINVTFTAVKSDYTNASGGFVSAMFYRGTGNVARTPNVLSNIVNTAGFGLLNLTLVANTSTQTADITLTGILSTTIGWYLSINTWSTS